MSESERFLISAALGSTSVAEVLGHGLTPEMFARYGEEWRWLSGYLEQHHRVPPVATFSARFPDFHRADVDDLDYQAAEVRKSYATRSLALALSGMADQLDEGKVDSALIAMQKAVVETAKTMGSVRDGDVLSDHADVLADVERFHDRIVDTGFAGIPTGSKTWDAMTGGCKPGEVIIVGGRLGHGKSWTMARMATSALMEGYTVLYDSLEMTRTAITLRMQTLLSTALGEPFAAADFLIGNAVPDLEGYKEMVAHLEDTVPGSLHVADTTKGRISPNVIAAQIERIRPDIVFIDYLTLLEMSGEGDWKSVSSLSKSIQSLAQQSKIPIVAGSQLNRADGRTKDVPDVDALSMSDAVGQDADQVMNGQKKSRRVMKYRLAKNRHGAGGVAWYAEWRPGAGVIEEIDKETAQELIDEDGQDDD